MLKESQKRTNLAALSELSTSSAPVRTMGWLATMPTLLPPRRAKPTVTFWAQAACTSR